MQPYPAHTELSEMTSIDNERFSFLRTAAAFAALSLLLVACADRDRETDPDAPGDWPTGLVPPIQGATFSMSEEHLPGSSLAGSPATSFGFDFVNGAAGRPLAAQDAVVAVAAGDILRIDAEYAEADEATRDNLADLADQPGFLGSYARDRLLGRQVWIRHETGHVSRYAHLAAVHPELGPGSEVEQGQVLGLIGNSGLPQNPDTPTAARLHFELWSEDAGHHLAQGLNPLGVHRSVADVFGLDALPDHARRVVGDAREGRLPDGPYPPEEVPDYEFSVDAPGAMVAGAPFAIAVTWSSDHFSPDDFYPALGGRPLGVIDAGNGAWILGAMPLDSAGEEASLTVAAVSPLGTTLAGSATIQSQEPGAPAPPLEVDNRTLERLGHPDRERETELLERVAYHSMSDWEPQWSQPFQAPLEEGTVVGSFGQKRYHGVALPTHPLPGVRLRVDADPTVRATNSGRVVYAETLPVRGRTVAISHGGGIVSVYAGLEAIGVEAGTLVERGQAIGQAGSTLQWEIHAAGTPGNPLYWVDRLLPAGQAGTPPTPDSG